MGPVIKFIGDCNVVQDPVTGELIIRIGENLNSSVFNNTDGQTTGTAKYTDNNSTYPATRITNEANSQSVWLKGASDTVTITTDGKIHFDNTLIYEDGKFLLPNLVALNSENLIQ